MGSVGPVGCWWALKCLTTLCFLMYYGWARSLNSQFSKPAFF